MKGETDKNYPTLFKNIGVKLINFYEDEELERFAEQLRQLLRENTPFEQIKKLSVDKTLYEERFHTDNVVK